MAAKPGLRGERYGIGASWTDAKGKSVDLDLQCVVVDNTGAIVDACYYNQMKAAGRGVTHTGDETASSKVEGIQEILWVNIKKLPENISVLLFVLAAYSGGNFTDVSECTLHILEGVENRETLSKTMEKSSASVNIVGAMCRKDDLWRMELLDRPCERGQHFVDILPQLGEVIRKYIPEAPARQKVAFAMLKESAASGAEAACSFPSDAKKILVGLGWDVTRGELDLDVSAVLVDKAGETLEAVFFSRLESDHGITHLGDNVTGEGEGDDEQITMDLPKIGPAVEQVFFVVNIFSPGKTFKDVANPFCRVESSDGQEFHIRWDAQDFGEGNALIISSVAREPGGRWKFVPLAKPCHARGRTYKDCLKDIKDLCQECRYAATAEGSKRRRLEGGE